MPAAAAMRVLVVDDQLTMRSLVRSGLKELGMVDVHEAVDGEEAFKTLAGGRAFQLVISDFNMPKLDGLSLLRAVRAHEPTRATAFIMLTGRADRELVQRAVQFGVNNYLVKPFTVATLREKIEAVFGVLT
jgi:two-component system, chemotaxis family, chemotaxis protein CheY